MRPQRRRRHRHPCDIDDRALVYPNRQRFRLQSRPAARRARHRRHVALNLRPRPVRIRLSIAPFQVVDHALELRLVAPLPPAMIDEIHHDRLRQSVQHRIDQLRRQLVERHVGLRFELLEDRLQHPPMPAGIGRRPRPWRDGPLIERLRAVRQHKHRIDLHRDAQTGAIGTRPVRRVKRERARLDLAQREHVARTRELLGKNQVLVGIQRAHPHDPVAQTERLLNRLRQPIGEDLPVFLIDVVRRQCDPVDHDIDRVVLVLLQLDLVVQRQHFAVHPHAHESAPPRILKHALVLALAIADHRRHDHQPPTLAQTHHRIDHLLHRLLRNRIAADRAVRPPRASEQQPQVVVNLRHRPHGRARVARAGLLVNRDRRRQTLDVIDVRLLHPTQNCRA